MKKYRIKQIDNKYYPQQRILFIWFYMLCGNALGSYEVWFSDIESTKDFIKERIAHKIYKPIIKKHIFDIKHKES